MFTFKIIKPKGKWAAFEDVQILILLKKEEVGYISTSPTHKCSLMVVKDDINEDGNPNCTWKWITLKTPHETVDDAKRWLNLNFEAINKKYKLHKLQR
jgi:hypothetical protein